MGHLAKRTGGASGTQLCVTQHYALQTALCDAVPFWHNAVMIRNCRDYLVYLFVRLFVCVLQAISLDACWSVSKRLAWLFGDVVKVRRRVLHENLQRAFPALNEAQRNALIRRMWEHLFLMLGEIAHAPRKIHDTNWREFIVFDDAATFMRFLWDDRAKMLVSGHYGNFELGGYMLGVFGFETYSVARTLDNKYLDRFINQFRGAKGQHLLPKSGSADEIATILANRQMLSVLADQHAGQKGCWVNFFGQLASTHKSIALFALANQAPAAVSCARRLDRPLRYLIWAKDYCDPDTMPAERNGVTEYTQWFTIALETMICQAPEQYWWVHRRWKGEPPARFKKPKPVEQAA
ncbi:MAG: lysophospholipid acyltransferase family protein [Planctomycetota bacterium]|nr:lysophospholipid acyltransferase family protein [Planctomycetota bacterium]